MYEVLVERQAMKQLAKIPPPYYKNIADAIDNLKLNPRPNGYKKLKGRESFRIRVANYRIIYTIKDDVLLILVLTIAHRKDVYE
jgi:mRNA interferase RelE/StbE